MDQLGAMRAFVRVVQTGSFSAVGRELNSTQATISKKVAALETKLGVKLLTRSSRDVSLTQAGTDYYEQCVVMLAELDEIEARVRSQVAKPQGRLRVSAPIAFGRLVIAPIIGEFLAMYPDIKVDMLLGDRHVDLVAEGVDLAIRARQLEDSSLVARHLFDNPMLLVASPEFLELHGAPREPIDLKRHNCIVYSLFRSINSWHFSRDGKEFTVPVSGSFQSDNGDTNLEVALAGVGIIQLPIWMVGEHLQSGRLIQLLPDYQTDKIPLNALYPQSRYVPLKVRSFVEFMKEKLADNAVFQ